MKRILIIGQQAREHALISQLNRELPDTAIYCAPGNDAIGMDANRIPHSATDIDKLLLFADTNQIDLTIVNDEQALENGIVDEFQAQGLAIFGPTQRAAELSTSRKFTTYITDKYKIAAAPNKFFDRYDDAYRYIKDAELPMVLKTEKQLGNKGIIICTERSEARLALKKIMIDRKMGDYGKALIIEKYLPGCSCSITVLTDGINFVALPITRIYKSYFDGGKGNLTNGMGAVAPVISSRSKLYKNICDQVILPVIRAMALENRPYRGALHTDMIVTRDGPVVTGFRCSLNDPATQTCLPLINSAFADTFEKCAVGKINPGASLRIKNKYAVCVVLHTVRSGKKIFGLDNQFSDNILIHLAGTKSRGATYITKSNPVMTVTACSKTVRQAFKNVYQVISKITYDGAYYRKDIALDIYNDD